jgi:hypothetical protein
MGNYTTRSRKMVKIIVNFSDRGMRKRGVERKK